MQLEKNKEDTILWQQFLTGDDIAYSKLYKQYIDDLFAYGMYFTSDRESVKDCIQDVFLSLYKDRSKLRNIDNLKRYLLASLKYELFDLFKKSIEYYQIDTMEPAFEMEYSAEDIFITKEKDRQNKTKIDKILCLLTPRQREVIYYRFVEELSYDDIGQLMQMNYQSVRNLIHRSILKIRETLPKHVYIYTFTLFYLS